MARVITTKYKTHPTSFTVEISAAEAKLLQEALVRSRAFTYALEFYDTTQLGRFAKELYIALDREVNSTLMEEQADG